MKRRKKWLLLAAIVLTTVVLAVWYPGWLKWFAVEVEMEMSAE
jgi:cytochrome c-type biogenesis protein CcmH/NrfG